MTMLSGLSADARQVLALEFRRDGIPAPDLAPFEVALSREIDVEPLQRVAAAAQDRFADDPVRADSWLAPRVHATLRLTRREAADPRIWRSVGIAVLPDYVRWRFPHPEAGTPVERFIGGENKHAVGRLWWGAEFLRNGSSYAPVARAFEIQDIPNSFNFDFFHNRPIALAAVRLLATFRGPDKAATGRQANRLLQAANMMLTTTSLDSLVPDEGPDRHATDGWVRGPIDETLLMDAEPVGPNDPPISEAAIEGAAIFLRRVAHEIGLRTDESAEEHESPNGVAS